MSSVSMSKPAKSDKIWVRRHRRQLSNGVTPDISENTSVIKRRDDLDFIPTHLFACLLCLLFQQRIIETKFLVNQLFHQSSMKDNESPIKICKYKDGHNDKNAMTNCRSFSY